MKKYLLFLLFLTYTCLGHAQSKPEFGFLVKAGNYALPDSKEVVGDGFGGNSVTNRAFSGHLLSLGIWQSISMGSHFRLSTELLYRRSFIKAQERTVFGFFQGGQVVPFNHLIHQYYIENSLSIPLKLHFSFKKNGKFSMALGAGLSHSFSGALLDENKRAMQNRARWKDFAYSKHINAGLHYRIDSKTELGLEYLFEQKAPQDSWVTFDCDCFCECPSFVDGLKPQLNSFSIALKHNMLKK